MNVTVPNHTIPLAKVMRPVPLRKPPLSSMQSSRTARFRNASAYPKPPKTPALPKLLS